ncbi:predicted protein [Pyrenophora tritici-repentis Pt-1C-BFP]|uniref:Uncharacterized protein n=1 Tax=Pyrenophora tritici-repentis (strain Pt-1C-BFP) TaxID=426418 RepID=B2WAI9_PYRTR|nr:uncharacterized protein PTRG_07302 [Pyrenophora tritici-repentis Pt-1C-BFP]EDU50221.1 predicted protein [Pyrenophora tritici-repentis Pt-1C-BFP]
MDYSQSSKSTRPKFSETSQTLNNGTNEHRSNRVSQDRLPRHPAIQSSHPRIAPSSGFLRSGQNAVLGASPGEPARCVAATGIQGPGVVGDEWGKAQPGRGVKRAGSYFGQDVSGSGEMVTWD